MRVYFKRNNSGIKKLIAIACIIIGFGIALYPFITESDMLSGARNIIEFLLSTGFLMIGAGILIDWSKTAESCSIDEDDDDYEE